MKWSLAVLSLILSTFVHASPEYFARFEYQQKTSYGKIIGQTIQPLSGDIFSQLPPEGKALPLSEVTLLLPTQPEKVFAVGMNFASHLSSPSNQPPPLFLKLPSSLISSGKPIQLPEDARNVHFEGELVLIIGKTVKDISEQEANAAIFGVTVGNDLTERSWQSSDLQWMRSKATDGFGPIGSVIATGVDFNNVLLTTKLNGKIVQQENTRFMIHKPAKVVSYLSRYFTLKPGDLIYMGTPGRTQSLSNGDEVSVSIEGVDTVINKIISVN
jgi:2-keto-4-pentenoate hydratase/2-oxohepta-3-ene-1,7-dioic acid hydratase in catechol pathway